MSRKIKLSDKELEDIKNSFENELVNHKWKNNKFNFDCKLKDIGRRATIIFRDVAWRKMEGLISEFDSEVGWHGIARRGEKTDEYVIEDIIVYPQEVTGVNVTVDQIEYQNWLINHPSFRNIRMQGHSHVNMSTSPSGKDWELYDGIFDQLEGDMFYIFMIWNKKNEKTIIIYDMKENMIFDTQDVTIWVEDDWYSEFIEEAKSKVKQKQLSVKPEWLSPLDSDWEWKGEISC